jgi:hypothetical protein
MATDKSAPMIQKVAIFWWDTGVGDVSAGITAYAIDEGSEEEVKAIAPLLKDWFGSVQLDVRAIEDNLRRILHSVFEIEQADATPYVVVSREPSFGGYRCAFVELSFGVDRTYTSFSKRDDRVRWVRLEVHQDYCRVDFSDDDCCGPPRDLVLPSLKIDCQTIAEAGLCISNAMGLVSRRRPRRPVVWLETGSPGDWYIRIDLE